MSSATLLPGVRLHPNGRSYQVRVSPFPPRAGFLTPEDAHDYLAELHRRKRLGILVAPESETATTLAKLTREHLARLEAVGGKRKRPYSPAGMKRAREECAPWLGDRERAETAVTREGVPFGSLPLAALDVRTIEVYLERRWQDHPRAAVGEQQQLHGILRLASRRGETFPQGLLALEPLKRRTERRHGLALDELRYLAGFAPEYLRRVLLIGATLGCRLGELLKIEDAWLDLHAGTLTVPAWACKERRAKVIDLLPEEVALFREQRLVRSPDTENGRDGTPLLFPRRFGTGPVPNNQFWRLVVTPARRKAAKAWRAERELPAESETPFDTWQPHDLRRGAATLLRKLGIGSALIAARFGHADQGQLIEARYADDVRRESLRRELDRIAADGGIDARLALVGGDR